MVPSQLNSRLGFINPGFTLILISIIPELIIDQSNFIQWYPHIFYG